MDVGVVSGNTLPPLLDGADVGGGQQSGRCRDGHLYRGRLYYTGCGGSWFGHPLLRRIQPGIDDI